MSVLRLREVKITAQGQTAEPGIAGGVGYSRPSCLPMTLSSVSRFRKLNKRMLVLMPHGLSPGRMVLPFGGCRNARFQGLSFPWTPHITTQGLRESPEMAPRPRAPFASLLQGDPAWAAVMLELTLCLPVPSLRVNANMEKWARKKRRNRGQPA